MELSNNFFTLMFNKYAHKELAAQVVEKFTNQNK
jgi:hypothetical protein